MSKKLLSKLFDWFKKKRYRFWGALGILGIILYFFSYCIVLPMFEKMNVKLFLYEPVEFLRYHSNFIWKWTEKGYRFFGGRVEAIDRGLFETFKRKNLFFYDNGNLCSEGIYLKSKNLCAKMWHENGTLQLLASETGSVSWESDGKFSAKFATIKKDDPATKVEEMYCPSIIPRGKSREVTLIRARPPRNEVFLIIKNDGQIIVKQEIPEAEVESVAAMIPDPQMF